MCTQDESLPFFIDSWHNNYLDEDAAVAAVADDDRDGDDDYYFPRNISPA